jgi:Holliday junction resolvase RusA-like endonuclease
MEVKFTILGEPMGKERPRFRRVGNYVQTYTPAKTKNYETKVRDSYYSSNMETHHLTGAIEAEIYGVFPIPVSVSKKLRAKMENGEEPYTKKVDADNLAKIILDALNGVAYDDDKQISKLSVTKVYGKDPRVEVTLRELTK